MPSLPQVMPTAIQSKSDVSKSMNNGIFFKSAFRFVFSGYKAVHAIPLVHYWKNQKTGFEARPVSILKM